MSGQRRALCGAVMVLVVASVLVGCGSEEGDVHTDSVTIDEAKTRTQSVELEIAGLVTTSEDSSTVSQVA